MDPGEIVNSAPGILKGVATLAGAIKFSELIKAILGPATAEVADRIRDEVRIYRFQRQLNLLEKAEQMAIKAGFTPKSVPIKLLLPLLDSASLEEDETLHTAWAALLANASDDSGKVKVQPSFIDLLRQLTPLEAMLLSGAYDASPDKDLSMIESRKNFLIFSRPAIDRKIEGETKTAADTINSAQSKSTRGERNFLPNLPKFADDALLADFPTAQWIASRPSLETLNEALMPFNDSSSSSHPNGTEWQETTVALENLQRLRLLVSVVSVTESQDRPYAEDTSIGRKSTLSISMVRQDVGCFVVSKLGCEFIKACRAPKKREVDSGNRGL